MFELGAPGKRTDAIALGLQCKHSEFGAGAFDVSMFILRLLCTNGMTGTEMLRKIHGGKVLGEGFQWSQETIALESKTLISALDDGISGMIGEGAIEKTITSIERMSQKQLDWGDVKRSLRKKANNQQLLRSFFAYSQLTL